ncbi:DUF2156 domain-containing protein [Staphylococcus chromogenes]|nr:DUF2156 domain-containing protein [Staphylococcus chromogenes]
MTGLRISKQHVKSTLGWAPVSICAVVLVWLLHAIWFHNPVQLRRALGFSLGEDAPLWTILTSGLTSSTLGGALLATLALLTLGVASEKILGSRRYLLYALILHVLAVTIGSAIGLVLYRTGYYWGSEIHGERVLAPGVWLFGVSALATAYMNRLWQRRVRSFLLTLTLTLLLYAGILLDFALISAVLLGLLAAYVLARRSGLVHERVRPSIRESRILVATVVGAVFVGPVLSALNPDAAGPLSDVSFLIAPQLSSEHVAALCDMEAGSPACMHALQTLRSAGIGPAIANFMPLLLVAVVVYGLARGRRLAWSAALAVHAATAMVLFQELHRLELIDDDYALSALVFLWLTLPWLLSAILLVLKRPMFRVRLARTSRTRFFLQSLAWLILCSATWLVGAWTLRDQFRLIGRDHTTVLDLLTSLPIRFLPPAVGRFYAFDVLPTTPTGWVLSEWIGIIFWVGFLVLFYRALSADPNPCSLQQRDQARQLLMAGSGDHLSWMTLWPGNSYWFGDGGYVAYRLHNSIAVTVGEPVCTSGADCDRLADAFEQHIYAQGGQVAWYSVRADFAAARARTGWRSVPVAQESVLRAADPVEFKGKKFQDVRTARNRAGKEGIRAVWTTWDLAGVAIRDQIVALSEEWVADKSLPEMGFTLGSIAELADDNVQLMVALDTEDRVHGVTSWLPCYVNGQVEGVVLDFMRRDTEGFRPVVEFLIAETLLRAHVDGLKWISLSGAPLAITGTGVLGSVLEKVGSALEPLYGFRSLAAFKHKFQPEQQEWLLAYRDELSLPAIGMAVSKCYVPRLDVGQAVHVVKHLRTPKK